MIPNNDLSFQMVWSRSAATLENQLNPLAELGHTDVQPFFFGPPENMAALDRYVELLEEHDLTTKSGHFTLDLFIDTPDLVEMIAGWFEMRPPPGGSCPIDHILGETVPFEPGLAWMVVGGADPLPHLKAYKRRIPAVHVKDLAAPGTCAGEKGFADLGHGAMDWQTLWAASVAAGAERMVVEHGLPSDWTRFARRSIEAMRKIGG
jgi:hypothetical protein